MGNRAPRNVLSSTALAAVYLFCPAAIRAAEDYSAWIHATDVILNTSATGANVAGPVNAFPVLVRLNAANFAFPQANGKGQDIRFAKAGGAPIAYEIERWDSVHAAAEIWIRADTVRGNADGQTLRMFWGNPAAADSSNAGNVFRSGDNFVAAWHLNSAGTAARPNAVTGGNPAVPVAYNGDEARVGIIAGADSLDGADDYLDLGTGYSQFAAGFTYSAWVFPTAVRKWAHVLDLGNGTGKDNIIVNRVDVSNTLGFTNWTGGSSHSKTVPNQWALNQWQFLTVTMTGKNVRMYKNGAQILADTLADVITAVTRAADFIGRSNWTADQYYQGMIDEPELSRTARSADWIKLAYQNQRAGQNLVIVKPADCTAKLSVPRDTTVSEGEILSLSATVECAEGYSWSLVSGPSARILDPEAKPLVLRAPRVSWDTAAVYRLTAVFSDSTRQRDVRVTIKETIPDPVFTLPVLPTWNGRDSLRFRPVISNLAAIKASRDSVLDWNWTIAGPGVDTTQLADGVLLTNAAGDGQLQIGLCLDNGSAPVCQTATFNVEGSAARVKAAWETHRLPPGAGADPGRDAIGRAAAAARPRARIPRFNGK